MAAQVFALIVFSCIIGEGYTNKPRSSELFCVFNHNQDACRYGVGIGVLGFLACVFFLLVDFYFPQISNVTDRKYLVLADLAFSGTSRQARPGSTGLARLCPHRSQLADNSCPCPAPGMTCCFLAACSVPGCSSDLLARCP